MDPYYPFSSPYHQTLRLQEQACRARMYEYEDCLRAKQTLSLRHVYDFPSERMYEAAREEQAVHQALVARLTREQALLAPPFHYDDEALIHSYATGMRASEYQQDLMHKLTRDRIAQDDHYRRLKIHQQLESHPYYPTHPHPLHPIQDHPHQYQDHTPIKQQPNHHSTNQFSSTNHKTGNIKNEAVTHRMEESPFKKIYGGHQSKSSKKTRSKSQSLNMTNMLDGSVLVKATLGSTENNEALKRIENRLRLSMVIFKDSKLRNCKHEINHLFNRYENESKVRREIKDKINCNPTILKKHAMVVQ